MNENPKLVVSDKSCHECLLAISLIDFPTAIFFYDIENL